MALLAGDDRQPRRRTGGMRVLFALGFAAMTMLAGASIGYLLRPQWADGPGPAEVPSLPIMVAGVVFNVPPAAIRIPMQRRAGPQERIDLAYQWPQLTAPAPGMAGGTVPLLFVTVERSQDTLAPAERLKTIYPRYIDGPPRRDDSGLVVGAFRDGSPYQGEDVIYDGAAPEHFLVRCSRTRNELIPAMCLDVRPFGGAALTFRFPRAWLADWRGVASGVDRLVESWRPTGK
jgi:hypothetical protein